MAKRASKRIDPRRNKRPAVRLATPSGRPIQLRYDCPTTGRPMRLSTGTRDLEEAEHQRAELEAKLLLGLDAAPRSKRSDSGSPDMPWEAFREEYRRLHLATLRSGSANDAEYRLDLATRILRPRRLVDLGTPSALADLQVRLLAGEESRKNRPRSPHTVRGYIGAVLAAMNWAYLQGWLKEAPRLRKLRVAGGGAMRGRPITSAEFQRMLEATPGVVGEEVATEWRRLLEGLWTSALRLGELLSVSWDLPGTIRPVWTSSGEPELLIPGTMQKNGKDESIPLLPWFADILLQTPEPQRTGWAFEPKSLQTKLGRPVRYDRPSAEWVGKVITRIGKAANVVVEEPDPTTGRKAKYASAHDLRRSCGERLRELGVPPLLICRVLRHSSWEVTRRHYAPGNIQNEATQLRRLLIDDQRESES